MACNSSAILAWRFPSAPSLQLPRGQEVWEILHQMCGEISKDEEVSEILQQMIAVISQTTTAEIVELANSAAPRSKLQELMSVYFYSCPPGQLRSPEAVIIHLLLNYFILWRDRREDKKFEEYIERLKGRVAELEKKLYESRTEVHQMKAELEERREPDPEIMRLTKQVQALKLAHGKLLRAHDELCHINKQWALDCDSLAQRMSALEERIEQLNDRMGRLEEELSRQSTSTDEGNDPDSLTPPYPQVVENCCAPSIFLYGELVYEYPHVSACPLHQDVSPHTGTVLSVEQQYENNDTYTFTSSQPFVVQIV